MCCCWVSATATTLHFIWVNIGRAAVERIVQGAPIIENGQRVWKTINDIDWDADYFEVLGADFERAYSVKVGQVGSATTRLFAQRAAVDFAIRWIGEMRSAARGIAHLS